MKIIDFHTHCFPDTLAPRAIGILAERAGITPSHDGTAAGLLASMDRAGITAAVIANIATNAKQVKNVNDFAIGINSDRLIAFGSVHPAYPDYKTEIDRLKAAGIRGMKFHCDYQETGIDDPAMMRIYEYVLAQGMLILLHTGRDCGLADTGRGTPKRVRNIADAFRSYKIVAAHMGGEGYLEESLKYLAGQPITLETSFGFLRDAAVTRAIISAHNPEAVVFGTDSPWDSQTEEIALHKLHIQDGGERERVFCLNAERLLGD